MTPCTTKERPHPARPYGVAVLPPASSAVGTLCSPPVVPKHQQGPVWHRAPFSRAGREQRPAPRRRLCHPPTALCPLCCPNGLGQGHGGAEIPMLRLALPACGAMGTRCAQLGWKARTAGAGPGTVWSMGTRGRG